MHYAIIVLILFALIHLICGVADIELALGGHLLTLACCFLWPLVIAVSLVVFILWLMANGWNRIGKQIRGWFVK